MESFANCWATHRAISSSSRSSRPNSATGAGLERPRTTPEFAREIEEVGETWNKAVAWCYEYSSKVVEHVRPGQGIHVVPADLHIVSEDLEGNPRSKQTHAATMAVCARSISAVDAGLQACLRKLERQIAELKC